MGNTFLLALLASFTCADYRLDQITHEPVPEGEKVTRRYRIDFHLMSADERSMNKPDVFLLTFVVCIELILLLKI